MAGDWIKMRADLQTHPKVVRIMSALKADKLRVIGGLHAVWCLFDAHSVDGMLDGYTPEALDMMIGWPGFSEAMISIDWLEHDGESLATPRFDEHNGRSAKRRSSETERKRTARSVDDLSASDADKMRSREEKIREDKEKNLKPLSGKPDDMPAGFAEFWSTWPKSPRKDKKAECLKRWKAKGMESESRAIIDGVIAKKGTKKWIDGYEPQPLSFLNQRQWLDDVQDQIADTVTDAGPQNPDGWRNLPQFRGGK